MNNSEVLEVLCIFAYIRILPYAVFRSALVWLPSRIYKKYFPLLPFLRPCSTVLTTMLNSLHIQGQAKRDSSVHGSSQSHKNHELCARRYCLERRHRLCYYFGVKTYSIENIYGEVFKVKREKETR